MLQISHTTSSHQSNTHFFQPSTPDPMFSLIEKIAAENGISCALIDEKQVIRLEKDGKVKYIKGYAFPINSSSSTAVTADKSATSDILKQKQIPQIRHRLFLNPSLGDWIPKEGTWRGIHQYAEKHHYNLVCKIKDGGAGEHIYHTLNGRELEQSIGRIFKANRDVVLCGFKPIKNEYRVVVYRSKVELILSKRVPTIVGDGTHSVSQLVNSYLAQLFQIDPKQSRELAKFIPENLLLSDEILELGKEIVLHWKHNGPGSSTTIIWDKNRISKEFSVLKEEVQKNLYDIALKTVRALGICFASIDVVELTNDTKGKPLRVLEVNSATMLDHRMDTQSLLSEQIAKAIYSNILLDLFLPISQRSHIFFKVPQNYITQTETEQRKHNLSDIISTIARTNGLEAVSHSGGWITHLSCEGITRLIYGYTFPLNNSTSAKMCAIKAATSAILKRERIPHIRHHRISLSQGDAWVKIQAFAAKHNFDVVCKPMSGTGGTGVEHARSMQELQKIVSDLLKGEQEVTLSAFKKIRYEYRLIMLNQEPEVIFRKIPPHVIGDGKRNVQTLVTNFLKKMEPKQRGKLIKNMKTELLTSTAILEPNEKVFLHWKHNLGQGATCELVGGKSFRELKNIREEGQELSQLIKIAQLTVKALDACFVSVDIAEIENEINPSKQLRVMEVNSGVMMDNLMEQHGDFGVMLAATVYTKVLEQSFNEER